MSKDGSLTSGSSYKKAGADALRKTINAFDRESARLVLESLKLISRGAKTDVERRVYLVALQRVTNVDGAKDEFEALAQRFEDEGDGCQEAEYEPVIGEPYVRVNPDGDVITRWNQMDVHRCMWSLGEWRPAEREVKARLGNVKRAFTSVLMYTKSRPLHCVVLETFVGPRPEGHVARWVNGDRSNCSVGNLEWATRSRHYSSIADMRTEHELSCLTKAQLDEINQLRKKGVGLKRLAKKYGVRRKTMRYVLDSLIGE